MNKLLSAALLLTGLLPAAAQPRYEITLNDGWQFRYEQFDTPADAVTNEWQTVTVPHDWAISGPFDKKWDLQTVRIEQNGEKQATEKSGRSGALPWIGRGYYKRMFNVPEGFNGHAELQFDGAMAEPSVVVNGQQAGYWAYGYNAFRLNITQLVKPGENTLEVNLKNVSESSRWYPGAGIYRPVKLVLVEGRAHIDDWSLCLRTLTLKGDKADIDLEARASGTAKGDYGKLMLIDADGKVVIDVSGKIDISADGFFRLQTKNQDCHAWTPEDPYLYTFVAQVLDSRGNVLDEKRLRTGIRTVRVSSEKGFELNGQTRKLRGVCLHHDLGPLGAAVNKAALIRQVKILKDMGCDAIRTAHNMPSQMQMEVCDSLGMMVMAESFDMWIYPKCRNGYARFFRDWADKDITNLVLANRHHPSIVMWSIGNEIPEQWSDEGRQIAVRLQGLIHSLDPTVPVTQGMDKAENALKSGMAQAMDVPGFNYRVHKYKNSIKQLPQGFLLGSETASTVSSRGVYYFPVQPTSHGVHTDGQCSSYDVEWCSWSNLPDDDWVMQDDNDWVIGEFVWTGFDYLGEPTPYDEYWPSRSSYFGICDLAGLPKDRFYLYRSHWNRGQHTVHLLPHWTWAGREGEVTPVYCYTDYPEAELFVNGKSQGRIRKNPAERLDRYRLRWNDVTYQPGELKVVVYDENGQQAGTEAIATAGKPHHLKLDVWTQQAALSPLHSRLAPLSADGEDLAFVTVSLVDKKGTLIPNADDQLTFDVSGAGAFRAVCNGDATSLEPFTQPTMKLFSGQLVVVVQAAKSQGTLTLTVNDKQRSMKAKVNIPVVR